MPKRNAEEKIEHYKNKIRRSEKKAYRRRIRCFSSSDSEQNSSPRETGDPETVDTVADSEPDTSPPEPPPSDVITVPEVATNPPCVDIETTNPTDPDLDPNILAALGEITDETPEFGEKIHENLAKISPYQLPLLKKGMTKENTEILLKNYLIPENCQLLQAPTLNLEVSAAIPESGRFRDKKMTASQQQLGLGITAVNRGLHLLVNNESKVDAIKFISDGCRILSDLHHQNTEARVRFILPGLDKSFLQFLDRSERDNTLFGNDLSEKIKASKAIVKQGEQIKKTLPALKPSSSSSRAQPAANRSSYQGNWSGPSRFQSNRGGGRGGQKRTNYRAPLASSQSKTNYKQRAPSRRH